MDQNYTISSKHFSDINLNYNRLLKAFHRYYPALKEHDVLFAYLSRNDQPSIILFHAKEDRLDEYDPFNYQLIGSHIDAGINTIKQTTSFFQGSSLKPKLTRVGTNGHFRYKLWLDHHDLEDSLYLWDSITDPRAIKLYDTADNRYSIFTTEDVLSFYLHLFQHYNFTITDSNYPNQATFTNQNGYIEVRFPHLLALDPNQDTKPFKMIKVDYNHLPHARQIIEWSIKVITFILIETDFDKVKENLKQEQDFINWVTKHVTSDCIKLRED